MKYLLVSDIHGSETSAKIIIEKFKKLNCDKIIILGDILYHGPRNDLPENYNPKKVIELLNSYAEKIIAVKGNCDAEVDQMVLNFKLEECKGLIVNNKKIYLTHGHHVNYLNPLNDANVDIVIHGHTHIIRKDIEKKVTYINLGSITLPKENTRKCYGIMDEKNIYIYDLYDSELLKSEI